MVNFNESYENRKDLNLQQRLIRVMEEVDYIQRETGKVAGQYRPISRNSVISKCRPILNKWGVTVSPLECVSYNQVDFIKKGEHAGYLSMINMKYLVCNADNPADNFVCAIPSSGYDTLDKGVNKAVTIGEKQLLLVLLHIEIGDEEDSGYIPPTPKPEDIQTINTNEQLELARLAGLINVTEEIVARSSGEDITRYAQIPSSKYENIRQRLQTRAETLKAQAKK